MTPTPPLQLGPARYYRPVHVRTSLGFFGGTGGYVETADPEAEPIVIEQERGRCIRHLAEPFTRR